MLTEACATGKPVYMFDTNAPAGSSAVSRRGGRPWWLTGTGLGWKPLTHRIAMRIGPRRMRRDIRIMQQELVADGRAVWLGQAFPSATSPPPLRDLERAVTRVRALFSSGTD